MYTIPIVPATLDLLEVLNGGVRPEIESEETFFVYRGEDQHAQIITKTDLDQLEGYWNIITVLYRNEK